MSLVPQGLPPLQWDPSEGSYPSALLLPEPSKYYSSSQRNSPGIQRWAVDGIIQDISVNFTTSSWILKHTVSNSERIQLNGNRKGLMKVPIHTTGSRVSQAAVLFQEESALT